MLPLVSCPRSSPDDAHDIDHAHHRRQGPEAEDDCGHLRVGQREAAKCDQVGHPSEGGGHLPGDSQPERDGDSAQQLRGGAEPRDPQAEAHLHRHVPEWEDYRQRGSERAV